MAIETAKQISAGFVVFRRTKEGPKFLLLYSGGKYWNFPKGKIEKDEKSMEAAVRETCEETGLKKNDLHVKRWFKAYERFTFYSSREKKKIFKTIIFYLAETRKRQVILPIGQKGHERHEGYGWFVYKDARELLKQHKDSEAVLKQANDFIRQTSRRKQSPQKP